MWINITRDEQMQKLSYMNDNKEEKEKHRIIGNHIEAYMRQKKIIDDRVANFEEFIDIQDYLANKRIESFKYNYSLEKECQNIESYPTLIELSKDFKYLTFINRKPNDQVKYILEADPEYIQLKRIREHKKMKKEMARMKKKNIDYQMYDPDFIN